MVIQGNIVDVWEKFAENNIKVDIGSDQTSLHNPWAGGYYPAGLSFEESNRMISADPEKFRELCEGIIKTAGQGNQPAL